MTLDTLTGAGPGQGRFVLVGYLPTYAGALTVLWLVWAGAPGTEISMRAAWRTATQLDPGEALIIGAAVTVLAVVFQPLQRAMVRVLAGDWPGAVGAGVGRSWQRRRKHALARRAAPPASAPGGQVAADPAGTPVASPEQVWRLGVAGAELRRRYPLPDHLVRPTALGNVLAAISDTAGRDHGWDPSVAWPRLYPLLTGQVRTTVDDSRDSLDGAVRLSVTAGVTALVAAALLVRSGWWLALVSLPLALAAVAYRGAVQAAIAYGDAVRSAFDLHRFDLVRALHLPLPGDLDEERAQAAAICANWRQGLPPPAGYQHPE